MLVLAYLSQKKSTFVQTLPHKIGLNWSNQLGETIVSQLSDGVSCLSWWFSIFMAKKKCGSRNGGKGVLAAVKLHCPYSENQISHKL